MSKKVVTISIISVLAVVILGVLFGIQKEEVTEPVVENREIVKSAEDKLFSWDINLNREGLEITTEVTVKNNTIGEVNKYTINGRFYNPAVFEPAHEVEAITYRYHLFDRYSLFVCSNQYHPTLNSLPLLVLRPD